VDFTGNMASFSGKLCVADNVNVEDCLLVIGEAVARLARSGERAYRIAWFRRLRCRPCALPRCFEALLQQPTECDLIPLFERTVGLCAKLIGAVLRGE